MDGTSHTDREDEQRKPSALAATVADRLREVTAGAMADPDAAEAVGAAHADEAERRRAMRREVRRRDIEIARIAALESMIHTSEFIAGRLPGWKREIFEHVRDPVASLANLSRAVIQLTLAEDRLDESDAERAERVKAEAEAKVRAEREAEAARAYTDGQIRRAEHKRQVKSMVRAVSLSSIRIPFDEREKLLDDLFRELENEDEAVSAYNGDPAETAADLCLRLGFGPKDVSSKQILERRAALIEVAREHIEGLRGPHVLDAEDAAAPDGAVVSFAQAAKAQGPPS